jgi:hypothetical protein
VEPQQDLVVRAGADLSLDVAEVGFDRVDRNSHLVGDLLFGVALGDEAEYFLLTVR